MSQKNLNIFVYSPLALENGRGGEISSMELASGLQKYYNITLMDTNILIGKSILSKEAINKKLKGLKKSGTFRFATFHIFNRCFDFPYPWEVFKFYKKIKDNDIIYASYHNIKMCFLFILFSLLNPKTNFIIGYRKPLYSEKLFSLYNVKYRLSILLFSLFKKRFYHHALSKQAKKFLEKFYDPKKVYHITHGIELDKFYDEGKQKKRKNLLNFVYIGYLDDVHKGVSVLLKAIKQFLDDNKNLKVFFEFCGLGPLEYELKKLENMYPAFIKFYGYISNEEISDYYKKNDVFLFTSRREPFPRVLLEALASELLVICTKTIGSVELLKKKNFAFFLSQLSPIEIKKKIFELYNLWEKDLNKFKELQKKAKNYVFKEYSFSKELEMFRDLINKISNFSQS